MYNSILRYLFIIDKLGTRGSKGRLVIKIPEIIWLGRFAADGT
jgi:hypothetical protein